MTDNTARPLPKTVITKGLGKGISALLGDDDDMPSATIVPFQAVASGEGVVPQTLSVLDLQPGKYQPRRYFNDVELQELAESIKSHGIIQPILVRAIDGNRYEIIAGERRWRAAQRAGLSAVPAIIQDWTDQQALEAALVENIQRADLNPMEEAEGLQRLLDEFGYTQEELARVVGKSRSHVTNMLRLLQLPTDVRALVEEGKLSMGHARALLTAANPSILAEEVISRGLSVRQTERLSSQKTLDLQPQQKAPSAPRGARNMQYAPGNQEKDPDIATLEQTLSNNIGLKVEIFDRGQQGEVVIRYESLMQLDDVLRRLGGVN